MAVDRAASSEGATLAGPLVMAGGGVASETAGAEQKRSGRRPQGRRKRGKLAALVLEPDEESLFSLGKSELQKYKDTQCGKGEKFNKSSTYVRL